MIQTSIERLLQNIGGHLAEDQEYPLDGTLLYAEVKSNTANISIYKNLDRQILYRLSGMDLFDLLLELWEASNPDRRWLAIEYLITGERFTATYRYADDPNWSTEDGHREQVVRRYFGNKPIVYPPLPNESPGLTFKF